MPVTLEQATKNYETQIKAIPNKTMAVAKKSKHFVMYDEPEWMLKQMDVFLAEK